MPRPAPVSLALLYERMDRLEELIEDMDDLGVQSRADAERLIGELDLAIEELEAQADDES